MSEDVPAAALDAEPDKPPPIGAEQVIISIKIIFKMFKSTMTPTMNRSMIMSLIVA